MWKVEYVTTVLKMSSQYKLKIIGLLNFSKIADTFIAEVLTKDMAEKRDKLQYGNQKNISTQHYCHNPPNNTKQNNLVSVVL